ncbi:phage holin [Spongiibacter tropicus]|uniref:phage holin n=1 Tax=Spongiibacter tropicus TaxID=454602 RepID=UPI0003B4C593|nr:phage holin [Spongiibacter tropicus]
MSPDKASTVGSYAASAVTTLAGLTINEWVAIGGLLIGAATFAVNVWFRHEQLKIQRDKARADARLALNAEAGQGE